TLFIDNCAACHGADGAGGPGFPSLAGGSPLWGRDPATLAETIRVGINSGHPQMRRSMMPAFGQGLMGLDAARDVAAYVRSLSGLPLSAGDTARIAAGGAIFAMSCAGCHDAAGIGNSAIGVPDL